MEKISFDKIWELLNTHGVIPDKRVDASNLWATYTPEQQHQLYATISSKIRLRKFVHYDPVRALWENVQTSITRLESPTNYAGKPLPRGCEFYFAVYNGQRGLTEDEEELKRWILQAWYNSRRRLPSRKKEAEKLDLILSG